MAYLHHGIHMMASKIALSKVECERAVSSSLAIADGYAGCASALVLPFAGWVLPRLGMWFNADAAFSSDAAVACWMITHSIALTL